MGWFDERDNAPGILTSTMAKDTTILNGVGGESLGPVFEAFFALVTGLVIAAIFSWKQCLVCLVMFPFLALGQVLEYMFAKGLTDSQNEAEKDALLLVGDAIINYKTVQSFGYEDRILREYKKLLRPI